MDIKFLNNELAEIVKTGTPEFEETGWILLRSTLFGKEYREQFESVLQIQEMDDQRFELSLYFAIRQRKNKNGWPIELHEDSSFHVMVTLQFLHASGIEDLTTSQVSEKSGYAISSTYQLLCGLVTRRIVERVRKEQYRLIMEPDRKIWLNKKDRPGRLSSLSEEILRDQEASVQLAVVKARAPDKVLARQLLMAVLQQQTYHKNQISYHESSIEGLIKQERSITELLSGEFSAHKGY